MAPIVTLEHFGAEIFVAAAPDSMHVIPATLRGIRLEDEFGAFRPPSARRSGAR